MIHALWLVPALPFAGFLILSLGSRALPRRAAGVIGTASVGLATLVSFLAALDFLGSPSGEHAFTQVLWRWMSVSGFEPAISLRLDPLSLTMMLVVCFVGFLIHLYSIGFMRDDTDVARFFAYMNLFVGSMLTLVLASDLLLLYLGWEGVGLCSYLLIGFWYQDPANGRAAQKAFIVTRVGDTAMALGLFLLFTHLGTLDIQTVLTRAPQALDPRMATLAAALLLGGALGKSAQLPLQTWLPDAMAGPTPVSALIHAATMVTAGVYLIARTHVVFELSPAVMAAVAVIGAATLFLAAVSALFQTDIKRVLAYSTMSQIGFMFLALGVGAWPAAIFHFATHAFFKALLFLAAGGVIFSVHHEHNIFRMGGLKDRLPVVYWTFLVGAASLAGLPFVTAGFYSKDWILAAAWGGRGGQALWTVAALGAVLTAVYSFRLVYRVFFGPVRTEPSAAPTDTMSVPLVVLATFAIIAGFLETPAALGRVTIFSDFLSPVLKSGVEERGAGAGIFLSGILIPIIGGAIGWWLYARRRETSAAGQTAVHGEEAPLVRFWRAGWGFDALYDALFIRPFLLLTRVGRGDVFDAIPRAIAAVVGAWHHAMSTTQSGRVRWYAAAAAAGSAVLLALVIFR